MKLVSLPDNKFVHEHLTLGKEYDYVDWSCDAIIITMDNGEKAIMMKRRLQ